jgi:ATP-dependent DNA helicase DinG
LYATPVDVATELHEALFSQVRHCVFTSATLTAGGNFRYALERLGLPADTPTLSLASPFDYKNKTLLYIPDAPFPEPATPGYPQALHERLAALINCAGGRTLALFTSLAAMDRAYAALRDQMAYPLLIQGEAPRRVLLQRFYRETDSVLFAVSSFWEGVDVPGESLSLVVIDKLPFEVPSDPVIMARMNRIKVLGGNPFNDYQTPRAILTLRQGAGRLMRTADDRGVIAILDTRLFGKGYGRQFFRSLPPSPISRNLDDVAAFFGHQPVRDGQPG